MASRVGINLRASAFLHQGDRRHMEDEFQVAYQRTQNMKDIEYAFFGVFDGHGGKEAAHYAKDNLMDNIVSQRLFWSDYDDDVLSAIKEGFIQTHMAMWKELEKWPRTASGWPSTSGTTSSIAFIRHQKIYIGHVGDSGIVLGLEDNNHEWIGIPLTKDHKPESDFELTRITECGGKVKAKSGVPRVVWNRPKSGHQGPVRRSTAMDEIPFLAVARSLGDLWSYNAAHNQFVVSPEPDVCVVDIDVTRHRCLIFGTDGLWNALSPSIAVNVVFNSEKNNELHYLGKKLESGKSFMWLNPSRCLVSSALKRYQKVAIRADNTSAVTVFLDPPGRPKKEVILQQIANPADSNEPIAASRQTRKAKDTPEASVKVHVYNQNSPNPETVCREDRPFEFSEPYLVSNCIDNFRQTIPSANYPTPPSHPNYDRVPTCNVGLKEDVASATCSKCDLFSNSCDSSPAPLNSSLEVSNSTLFNLSTAADLSCTNNFLSSFKGSLPTASPTKVDRDDIQIPLVSSSSSDDVEVNENAAPPREEVADTTVRCLRKNRYFNSLSSVKKSKSDIKSSDNKASALCSNVDKKIELPDSASCHPVAEVRSSRTNKTPLTPVSMDRVLKNSNRGSWTRACREKVAKMAEVACKERAKISVAAATKRKRSKEILQEDRCSKTLRIRTRSSSLSHKPMVTRSQRKCKKKAKDN